MSELENIKKIRKILKLNEKWELLSPAKKGIKLQNILENYFLNHQPIYRKEFDCVVSALKETLEKQDLVIDKEIDKDILNYLSVRKTLADEDGEDVEFVLVHFGDCSYIIEIFCVADFEEGIFSPYFTLSRDDRKYRNMLNSYLSLK
jgi:hypothetical protein